MLPRLAQSTFILVLTLLLLAGIVLWTPFFSIASSTLPQPRFLFVTEHDAGKVAGYIINPANGSLKPTGQVPVWAHWGPLRAAVNKTGTYLYVANEGSHDVSVYSINRTNGYLTIVAGSPFPVAGTGSNVAVHPSGKYVYVTTDTYHGGNNSVSAFSVKSNGSLAPVPGSPFPTQNDPVAVAIDPSGKFLYTTDFAEDYIDAYTISATDGALTPVPGEPYRPPLPKNCPCGDGAPADIAINATGTRLYTADAFAGSIAGYKIDRTTGTLSSILGSPFVDRMPSGQSMDPAFNPYSIAIRPQGNFMYGYDSGDEDISVFGVNATTGVVKLLSKTPNTYGGVAAGDIIRVDPSGQYAYALGTPRGQTHNAVLGFHINPTTGGLTSVPGSPLKSNSVPFIDGVAVTP
jgi:6-phosphogluconolactonase